MFLFYFIGHDDISLQEIVLQLWLGRQRLNLQITKDFFLLADNGGIGKKVIKKMVRIKTRTFGYVNILHHMIMPNFLYNFVSSVSLQFGFVIMKLENKFNLYFRFALKNRNQYVVSFFFSNK